MNLTSDCYVVPARKSKYQSSLEKTEAMRAGVPLEDRAIFDNQVRLAEELHRRGYYKRSGRALARARAIAILRVQHP